MSTLSSDHQLYLAYRLRELPPAERDAIDDRLLTDDEFSDRMQAAEYDLLDDYRANRLTADVRGRVERAFSREELRQSPFIPQTNVAQGAGLRRPAPRFSLAFRLTCAAAACVVAVIVSWLIALHVRPDSSTQSAVSRAVAPSMPRDSGNSSTRTVDSASHSTDETAVLLLAPAVTRGGASAQLELRPLTHSIKVQWLVPSHLAGCTFSLLIQRNGKNVAVVPASDVQHVGGADVEEFNLPRAVFSAAGTHARYIFLVRKYGATTATEAEFAVRISENFDH